MIGNIVSSKYPDHHGSWDPGLENRDWNANLIFKQFRWPKLVNRLIFLEATLPMANECQKIVAEASACCHVADAES
jgi:hypothetical protein